jgi:hypothetical protein
VLHKLDALWPLRLGSLDRGLLSPALDLLAKALFLVSAELIEHFLLCGQKLHLFPLLLLNCVLGLLLFHLLLGLRELLGNTDAVLLLLLCQLFLLTCTLLSNGFLKLLGFLDLFFLSQIRGRLRFPFLLAKKDCSRR